MNTADALALLPLEVEAGTIVAVMLAIAIRRSHVAAATISMIGILAAFGCLWLAPARQVTPLLVIDSYGLYYFGLILAAAFVVCLLSYGYLKGPGVKVEELYLLVLIATLGSGVLVFSSHFASFFLGLELLSVSLYAMIGYLPLRPRSLEAGVKYLVLAAASTAFLLFGMALIYAELGTMEFVRIAELVRRGEGSSFALLATGTVLVLTGMGFKLAVAPFHMWTPDIYEGAPAPVTAFVATVSKGAMFALLMRYFYGTSAPGLGVVFAVIAIASMIAGNLLALLQRNIKRILAYSSIAHLGYLLVAFDAGGALAPPAVAFYLTAYFITTLGAFGIVAVLSPEDRDADAMEDYRGLFWRRPVLASVFAAMLLSLAGIPLTAGFMAKVYVVAAGASAAIWAQVLVLVITSGIGLYYYLRVIVAMFGEAAPAPAPQPPLGAHGAVALAALAAALIWLGVYPGPLLALIQAAVAGMG